MKCDLMLLQCKLKKAQPPWKHAIEKKMPNVSRDVNGAKSSTNKSDTHFAVFFFQLPQITETLCEMGFKIKALSFNWLIDSTT